MRKLLVFDPSKRFSVRDALDHPYLQQIRCEVNTEPITVATLLDEARAMFGASFHAKVREVFSNSALEPQALDAALEDVRSLNPDESEQTEQIQMLDKLIPDSTRLFQQKLLRCINATHEPICKSGKFDELFAKDCQ